LAGKISDSDREEVIRRRLSNQTFDKIASEMGISHGIAVKIVKDWIYSLEQTDASAVLTLARVVNEQGITPAQCAEGARLVASMQQLGVTPETLDQFLYVLYSQVIAKEMAPSVVATTLMQVSTLSQELEMPLDHVPETLKNAYNTLDEINAQITDKSSTLEHLRDDVQSALDEVHTTRENMALFLKVEEKLRALGLSLGRIDDIVNVINNVEKLDGDPAKMSAALAEVSSLQEQREALGADIEAKEEKARHMEEKIAAMNAQLATMNDMQTSLNAFVALGFTPDMLLDILEVIQSVAQRRSLPFNLASAAFMAEVKGGYESVSGFRAVLQNLQASIGIAQALLNQEQTKYATLRDSVNAVNFLHGNGVEEKDLLYWQKVFRDHPKLTREMLTASLRKYADLSEEIVAKEDLLKKLDSDVDRLKLASEYLSKENSRVAAQLAQAKETAAEEERQIHEKMERLSKQAQQILLEVSIDAVRQTAQNALLEGISLKAAYSPLLPIILWENKGPVPHLKDVFRAADFVLEVLKRILDPSDPLASDLENFVSALNKRIYGGSKSTATSNSGNGGSASSVKSGVGAVEAKK
jgi:predicted  nucleic acid-binding Zn-ribbon protein